MTSPPVSIKAILGRALTKSGGVEVIERLIRLISESIESSTSLLSGPDAGPLKNHFLTGGFGVALAATRLAAAAF